MISFLKKKPFNYNIIPNQKKFLDEILKVNVYPSHFLIDGEGIVKKVTNNAEEIIDYFEIYYMKNKSKNTELLDKLPPPPPPPAR